jgi:hypothetical protein
MSYVSLIGNESFLKTIKKDLAINKDNLEYDLIELPYKVQKYVVNFKKLKTKLDEIQTNHDKVYGGRYIYYRERYDLALKHTEIDTYVKKDDEYIIAKQELDKVTRDVDFLESTLKNLDSKMWCIRYLLDYWQFLNKSGQAGG